MDAEILCLSMTMSSLKVIWNQYSLQFGAGPEVSQKYWAVIQTKYSEPQRYYHTLKHLEEMFCHFNNVKGELEDQTVVAMAIFFHDVIYDPTKTDNEEKSAELFLEYAGECSCSDTDEAAKIYDWIIQTKSHMTDVTMETGAYAEGDKYLFLDIDMAILGTSPGRYAEYAGQIRQEYSHRTDFSEVRAKVLQKFLERKNIYNTKHFRSKFEALARSNVDKEIQDLQAAAE